MKHKVRAVRECYLCKDFIEVGLDEFVDNNWIAYKMSNASSLKCFCPDHLKEGNEEMIKDMEEQAK